MKAVNSAVLREIYTETLLTCRHRFCNAYSTSFLKAINMVMNGGDKLQALSQRRRFFARVYKSGGIGVPWGPCTTVNLLGSDGHGACISGFGAVC